MISVVPYSALQELPFSDFGVNTELVFQVFANDPGKRACSDFDVSFSFSLENCRSTSSHLQGKKEHLDL
jgi:hypothetical protein